MTAANPSGPAGGSLVLWTLLAVYAAARVLQSFPDKIPVLWIVALHVLPPALFAVIHGARLYGVRGILVFAALCLLVGGFFENLGIRTGFPFGPYHFTSVMGPALFGVPILLALAYVGMGYVSWTLARLILGDATQPHLGTRMFATPLLAAFIMVSWDLSMDPVWSTVVRAWIWHRGGPYFGVPVTNFLGWYLTSYLYYQCFALYLRKHPSGGPPLPSGYWRQAILFYGVSAAGNLLVIPRTGPPVVADAAGVPWRVADILVASAAASVLTMGTFTAWAWVRMTGQKADRLGYLPGQTRSGRR